MFRPFVVAVTFISTAGRSQRGVGGAACNTTYESCMRTGVWDARPYPYGVLRSGMQKK
jgi:hypothetical protein